MIASEALWPEDIVCVGVEGEGKVASSAYRFSSLHLNP